MEIVKVKVSYRDKTTSQNVELGSVEAPRFATVDEAVAYFDKVEEGKGVELVLDYIHAAYDISLQNTFRAANRPDRAKSQSLTAKFKQMTPEQQAELLRNAGIEV